MVKEEMTAPPPSLFRFEDEGKIEIDLMEMMAQLRNAYGTGFNFE